MPLTHVNGIDLYYESVGAGDSLLLIAGTNGTTLTWAPLMPALTQRFGVIAFDNRGSGRSSAPTSPYSTRQMADDAAALLDHLGVERAHVFGLSPGGAVAQELALAYPERIERLVLLATGARLHPLLSGPWLEMMLQARERGLDPAGLALWLMPWLFTPAFMARHDLVEAALDKMLSNPYPTPSHGLAGQIAAARNHDTRDRVSLIAAPTLVLVGVDDIISPVSDARELAQGIPGARLQILERGGHIPFLEYPEAVAEAIIAFLTASSTEQPRDLAMIETA